MKSFAVYSFTCTYVLVTGKTKDVDGHDTEERQVKVERDQTRGFGRGIANRGVVGVARVGCNNESKQVPDAKD